MYSSAAIALATLAAVAPCFAAPTLIQERDVTPESGAISLSTIGTIASVGGSIIGGIIDHFKSNGNQQQRRDALELEQLLARATDESGAFGLDDAVGIAKIANGASKIWHAIDSREPTARGLNDVERRFVTLPGSSGIYPNRRPFLLEDRRQDESGAIDWDTIKDVGSIASSAYTVAKNIYNDVKGRETLEARFHMSQGAHGPLGLGMHRRSLRELD